MNTIEISGITYNIKISFRSIFIFEEIRNKLYEIKGTEDLIAIFYGSLKASNPDFEITYEAFIDYLDENSNKLTEFAAVLKSLAKPDSTDTDKKKASS